MSKDVSHKGKVVAVSSTGVRVEIISQSACSSCHAAGLCSMSEAVKKEIDVPAQPGEEYHVGDDVKVILGSDMGMKAVVLAYVIPLALLLVVCISLTYTGMGELYAGLAGLGAVAVYYFVLYLMRKRVSGKYVFKIEKENNLNS